MAKLIVDGKEIDFGCEQPVFFRCDKCDGPTERLRISGGNAPTLLSGKIANMDNYNFEGMYRGKKVLCIRNKIQVKGKILDSEFLAYVYCMVDEESLEHIPVEDDCIVDISQDVSDRIKL